MSRETESAAWSDALNHQGQQTGSNYLDQGQQISALNLPKPKRDGRIGVEVGGVDVGLMNRPGTLKMASQFPRSRKAAFAMLDDLRELIIWMTPDHEPDEAQTEAE